MFSVRTLIDPVLLVRAVEVYELDRIDFAETYLVAQAESTGVRTVASFDKSIDRVTTIERPEPAPTPQAHQLDNGRSCAGPQSPEQAPRRSWSPLIVDKVCAAVPTHRAQRTSPTMTRSRAPRLPMTTNWSVAGSQRHTDGRAKAGDAWQHGVMAAEPADACEVIHLWQDERPVRIDDVGPEVAYSAPAGLAAGTTFLRNICSDSVGFHAAARRRQRRRRDRGTGGRLDDQRLGPRGSRSRPLARRSWVHGVPPQVPGAGVASRPG